VTPHSEVAKINVKHCHHRDIGNHGDGYLGSRVGSGHQILLVPDSLVFAEARGW